MSVNNGQVLFYTKGTYEKEICFPENDVSCQWCAYCRHRTVGGKKRHICSLTYEALNNIQSEIGGDCPLIFRKEE